LHIGLVTEQKSPVSSPHNARHARFTQATQATQGPKETERSSLTQAILCDKFKKMTNSSRHWPLLAYVAFFAYNLALSAYCVMYVACVVV